MYGGKCKGDSSTDHMKNVKLAKEKGDWSIAYAPMADTSEEIDKMMQELSRKLLVIFLAGTVLFAIFWTFFFVFTGEEIYGTYSEVTPTIKARYTSSLIILILFFSFCFGENMTPQEPYSPFTNPKIRNSLVGLIFILLLIPPAQVGRYLFNRDTFLDHFIIVVILLFSSVLYGMLIVSNGLKYLIIILGINKQYQLYGSGGSRVDIVEALTLKQMEENNRENDGYSNS